MFTDFTFRLNEPDRMLSLETFDTFLERRADPLFTRFSRRVNMIEMHTADFD